MLENSSFHTIFEERLREVKSRGGWRQLCSRSGVDFSSNDYLGFCADPCLQERTLRRLQGVPTGSSGSRLLRGNSPVFECVEKSLAAFCGQEAALFFPSGYQANLAVLSSVLRAEDTVYSDELNHASIVDGIRLSSAKKAIFKHGNLDSLRELLEAARNSQKNKGVHVIVTESVFSMSGDQAPLRELVQLADHFSALLIVDESHATGIWGDSRDGSQARGGGGLVQRLGLSHHVLATVHTGGKALGVGGAWIGSSHRFKEYCVNFSRPFIFSTAPSPYLAIALEESLDHWRYVGPTRVEALFKNLEIFKNLLKASVPEYVVVGNSPIISIVIGDNFETLTISKKLKDAGLDVRAIRPPTVPEGTSRLRIVIRSQHTKSEIESLVYVMSPFLQNV